jgi:YesN/AraC family two-component response regulator
MMEQIRQRVGVYFQTVGYTTGEKGIAGVLKDKPALLICDVMLPDTNGFEIIKNLKKEPSMRNMPTIMLTALGDDEQQIRGYKAGVDDYMVKPCNYNLLILRIIQLIRWYAERQQTEEKLEASPSVTASMKETSVNENSGDLQIIESTADKKFLDRLHTITLQHLGEEDFNMNQIPEMLKMGRTKFFGKVKDLTGVTPSKYINNMRMDMAAELLKEGEMNIKEICFKLGIPDVSYFTRLFKDRYGIPPSKYKNEN